MFKNLFLNRSKKGSKVLAILVAFLVAFVPIMSNSPTNVQAATTTLKTYPAPTGAALNNTFTVQVRANGGAWQNVDIYTTCSFGIIPQLMLPSHISILTVRLTY